MLQNPLRDPFLYLLLLLMHLVRKDKQAESARDLNFYAKSDIVGRTDMLKNGISLWLDTGDALLNFAKKYPHWTAVISIVLFIILIGIIVGIAKCIGCNPFEDINDVFVQWKDRSFQRE